MQLAKKLGAGLALLLTLAACGGETPDRAIPKLEDESSMLRVVLNTNRGDIELELDEEKAPITVANFLTYADSGHYDGTIFHRVIPNFMVQGGGFTESFEQKPVLDPIQNEATNGLLNLKYSISMARTAAVNSATSQFFINVVDNGFLDHVPNNPAQFGYAVFGRVVSGQEIVDGIAATPTGSSVRFPTDVPVEAIVINSVTRQ